LIHHIRSRLSEFVTDAPQSDDITMLIITYHGHPVTAETP
jgi:serine phosphatase RsbU (regulator of sigma subunit)